MWLSGNQDIILAQIVLFGYNSFNSLFTEKRNCIDGINQPFGRIIASSSAFIKYLYVDYADSLSSFCRNDDCFFTVHQNTVPISLYIFSYNN